MQTANPGISASEAQSKILAVSIPLKKRNQGQLPWRAPRRTSEEGGERPPAGSPWPQTGSLGCACELSSSCACIRKRVRNLVDSDLLPLSRAVCCRGWPQPSQIWDKPTDTGAPRRRERESHDLQGSCSQKLLMRT